MVDLVFVMLILTVSQLFRCEVFETLVVDLSNQINNLFFSDPESPVINIL